jgi:hypothetical protein
LLNRRLKRTGVLRIVEAQICPEDFGRSEPEDYRFVRAFQNAGIADFQFGYLVVYRGKARVSTVPYFLTDYRLNTLVTNPILKWLLAPLSFKVACVGHPSTDAGWIEGEKSEEVLDAVSSILRAKAPVTAYKWFLEPLPLNGFVEVAGLPISVLRTSGEYPASFGHKKRKNLLKKLEKSSALAFVEYTPDYPLPEALIADIHHLYQKTAARANLHFEQLTADYFRLTAGISTYLLALEGDRPIGFAQWIRKEKRMAGKYVGMAYDRSRAYELYFGLAIRSIQNGLRDGVTEFELGVVSYYSKRLLGAELMPTHLYFRHRNALVHRVLEKCRFLLEPSAEELK